MKYIIAKEPHKNEWCAYWTIFGMWNILTCITESVSLESAEDCEANLINLLKNGTDPIKVKEVVIK